MKQFYSLLLTVLVVCSCGSFEDKAKEQLKSTIKEIAINPDTYKIDNLKTMYVCDSLCDLQFIGRGQNGLGGWSKSKFEYVYYYYTDDDGSHKYKEAIFDLEDDNSPYECANEEANHILEIIKNGEWEEKTKGTNKYSMGVTVFNLYEAAKEGFPLNDEEKVKDFVICKEIRLAVMFKSRVIEK